MMERAFAKFLSRSYAQNVFVPNFTFVRFLRFAKKFSEPQESLADFSKKALGSKNLSKVDIGLPPPKSFSNLGRSAKNQYLKEIKNNNELEKKSRNLQLNPDLNKIREEWEKESAPKHIQTVAEHYHIFEHLFDYAYFTPYVIMNVFYNDKESDMIFPVCRGNLLKPTETFSQPEIQFKSNPEDLWTLTLVNPDGNLIKEDEECIHWFIGNIPGGDVKKGEVIWDYLPPFPARGLGFQRLIFILYKQEKKLDYSKLKQSLPCLELTKRTFKTLEFYRERQEYITPAGLAFFQSDWDKTSKYIYHEVLNMEEPIFEYDHKPKQYNKQKWYPKKQPFNLYLDRYRDPKDINKEYLLKKLGDIKPFQPYKRPFPYPKAVRVKYRNMPSWLKVKERRYDVNVGRVQNLPFDEYK